MPTREGMDQVRTRERPKTEKTAEILRILPELADYENNQGLYNELFREAGLDSERVKTNDHRWLPETPGEHDPLRYSRYSALMREKNSAAKQNDGITVESVFVFAIARL